VDGTSAVVTVLVALITAGIPAWAGFRRLRAENSAQHAASFGLLERLDHRTEQIHDTLTDHLRWHAHEEDDR
jgi:hypothetical protein